MGEQETLVVVLVHRGDCAALVQQAGHRQAGLGAGVGKRLVFQAVLVRLVGQFEHLGAQGRRQLAPDQGGAPLRPLGGFPGLALHRSLRRGQHVCGGGPVAALATLVEIDGGVVQGQQDGRRLGRRGGVTVVFPGQFLEAEFGLPRRFPEEVQVQFRLAAARLVHDLGRRRRRVLQQHVGRLHLGALAVLGLHLEGTVVVRQDGAGLDVAVFFVEDIHGQNARMAGRYSAKRVKPWSPPSSTVWRAPAKRATASR
jgi:hypothetical protein